MTRGELLLAIVALVAATCHTSEAREELPDCGPGAPAHVPHPTDCSKYYTCENGVPVLLECPPGLWWSVAIEGCDWPETAQCAAATSSSAGTAPTGTTTTDGTTGTGTTDDVTTWPPTEEPSSTDVTHTSPVSTEGTTGTETWPPTEPQQ